MSSSIPGAIQNFLELCTGVLPDDSLVWFGKQLGKFTAPLTLQVSGVEIEEEPAELGPLYRVEERYSLMCSLTSFAGDEDFTTRMEETFTNYALVTVALANNYTLNGAVRWARPSRGSFYSEADQTGKSIGILAFEIYCEQRITSLT